MVHYGLTDADRARTTSVWIAAAISKDQQPVDIKFAPCRTAPKLKPQLKKAHN
ncbi:hypothetical protein PILCRDRAFT_820563, partial [Piloderma croceum F 1598]